MTVSAPLLSPQVAFRPQPASAEGLRQAAERVESAGVDTFSSSAKASRGGGTEIGNSVSTMVGGALGLGMVIPGLYAGVLGGAVVGSLLGAGFGPAVASIASEGALGFLSTSWQTAGLAARAGMFVGGASGLVGGWKMGTGLGHGLGRILGAAKNEDTSEPVQMKGAKGVVGSVISGGGLAAGAVGGGILGASVAASGSLIRGLAGQGFQLSALNGVASAAGVGGLAGLVTFGVVGGVGGYAIAKGVIQAGNWVYDKVAGAAKPQEPAPRAPETKTN